MAPELHCRAARRENNIDIEPDELAGNLGIALAQSLCPAVLDCDGAALDPIELA